ncbi:immunoglobulin E-set [Podospora didyma]|uniref:Immunoglobulin E-set n=1 Tax=Podospora didyma TaxID=330526 RepID=A0AAE0U3B3_9PEZI|nr:immunoglobulin E-set [Podospora didyma]
MGQRPAHPSRSVSFADGEREGTAAGRPYGALPRTLERVPSGVTDGILMSPYTRYGSPHPCLIREVRELMNGLDRESELDSGLCSQLGETAEIPAPGLLGQIRAKLAFLRDRLRAKKANWKKRPDANDESLQRYKESLGLTGGNDLSDPNDPRACIILSLSMEAEGRDPVVIDLSTPGSEAELKKQPFKIKEGAKFTMTAKFKVQHNILSGLKYVQLVKRKGITVNKTSEMIGSFAPCTDKKPFYTKTFNEEEAPSGMLARGNYTAISTFVDDDKKTHLKFEWAFSIGKDW